MVLEEEMVPGESTEEDRWQENIIGITLSETTTNHDHNKNRNTLDVYSKGKGFKVKPNQAESANEETKTVEIDESDYKDEIEFEITNLEGDYKLEGDHNRDFEKETSFDVETEEKTEYEIQIDKEEERNKTTLLNVHSNDHLSDVNLDTLMVQSGRNSMHTNSKTKNNSLNYIYIVMPVLTFIMCTLLIRFLPSIIYKFRKSKEQFVVVDTTCTFTKDHNVDDSSIKHSRISVEMRPLSEMDTSLTDVSSIGPVPDILAPSPPIIAPVHLSTFSRRRSNSSLPRVRTHHYTSTLPRRAPISDRVTVSSPMQYLNERRPFLSGTFFTNGPDEYDYISNASSNGTKCMVMVDVHE